MKVDSLLRILCLSAVFAAPVLIPGYASHTWLSSDGELETLDGRGVALRLRQARPLACHGPSVARRVHLDGGHSAFADVLSLFAFVRPARWCVPTPAGLAHATGLPAPVDKADQATALLHVTQALIRELAVKHAPTQRRKRDPTIEQLYLAQSVDWPFATACLQALGQDLERAMPPSSTALQVWRGLSKWDDAAPPGRPGNAPVDRGEAERILDTVVREGGGDYRPEQRAFASGVVGAFAPAQDVGVPSLVLAEAGTGVGKTLGYLAPAFAWKQKNRGAIWLSTYTRNLQRQLDQELNKLYPNPALKEQRVVVRKGRENYLCFLNMEAAVKTAPRGASQATLGLVLMARWAAVSRAGELVGGDCPGWLRELVGLTLWQNLAVRRGECWHGACPHYGTCFAEKMARKAPHAEVVVANHAFVMTQTLASPSLGAEAQPTHFVFDEGHHLFDAADGAFAACLSGIETWDLRRWIQGSEQASLPGFAGHARGLRKRLEDLVDQDSALNAALHALEKAAAILPAQGWYERLKAGKPKGPVEAFLAAVAHQVYAHTPTASQNSAYSIEIEARPARPDVIDAARDLSQAIRTLLTPLRALEALIQSRLEETEEDGVAADTGAADTIATGTGAADTGAADDDEPLGADQRRRLGGIANSLAQRAVEPLRFFESMLNSLDGQTPSGFVDWFEISRKEGQDMDVAFVRKYIDPTAPFMALLAQQAQGALITSATLTDQTGLAEVDWDAAETQTGARHMPTAPLRLSLASPYDYAEQTQVFVVNDLDRGKPGQAATAMAKLFQAAGGGALGLFTSITRLQAAYQAMAPKLEAANLPLLAQHVDRMDVTTLIDIFRAETHTCLLGTDALRDGVDVPGAALRLLVFDRVPWPRPSLAHRARRAHFGPRIYDDRLTRLRLRQAFGRLVRTQTDRGAFVMLDARLPSRLEGAFPDGVVVHRLPLKETLAALRLFYET